MISIPDEPDSDAAKDTLLAVCKSALEMDIAQMARGWEKWGFRLDDFERLSDPNADILQEYMVWLESNYGPELAKTNIGNWLVELTQFPWVGHWHFVVKWHRPSQPSGDFTVSVIRWLGPAWSISGHGIRPGWPADKFICRTHRTAGYGK